MCIRSHPLSVATSVCPSSIMRRHPEQLLWTSSCSWPGHSTILITNVDCLRVEGRRRGRQRLATQQQFQFVKREDGRREHILDSDITARLRGGGAGGPCPPSCLKSIIFSYFQKKTYVTTFYLHGDAKPKAICEEGANVRM